MREIKGNLWNYFGKPYTVVLITTNGFVKKNGEAVMGRGCAREACKRFPRLAEQLGDWIQKQGNIPCWLRENLATFPVKHNWWMKADPELIAESAKWLCDLAMNTLPDHTFILPRPGCGNGQLSWLDVKPLIDWLPDNVVVIDFERLP